MSYKYGAVLLVVIHILTAPVRARTSCPCTRILQTTCGSDGKLYSNMCEFDCAHSENSKLTVVDVPACKKPDTNLYSPVCGNDGVTYSTSCRFECAKNADTSLAAKHDGECKDNKN
ncbi:hypothetical protein K1T71_009587 [Dendrolimus kikuchii]|uniref:Uncharacterized protein n=1 Tax=Dendrolimus kikuchii TaxID=765133 RepID=A0ACC1CS21_9NEOP|nr:hypothetical protein K1T71_009587 [Dendrolimus kikuchii]